MVGSNPFTPTFGHLPQVLAGRERQLAEVLGAIQSPVGHPALTTLVMGERGMGKTVLLREIEDRARSIGWLVAFETVGKQFLAPLTVQVRRLWQALVEPKPRRKRLTSPSAGSITATWSTDNPDDLPVPALEEEALQVVTLRQLLREAAEALLQQGTGIVIMLDELHNADVDQLRRFGAVIQEVTRGERLPVGFLGAALPKLGDTLQHPEAPTFLQRCWPITLSALDVVATTSLLADTAHAGGAAFEPEALEFATAESHGHPYLAQLIGYVSWSRIGCDSRITLSNIEASVSEAQRLALRNNAIPLWRRLSHSERALLWAMCDDQSASRVGDLAKRLGKTSSQTSAIKSRLVSKGMLRSSARGIAEFAHPGMRDWLLSEENH